MLIIQSIIARAVDVVSFAFLLLKENVLSFSLMLIFYCSVLLFWLWDPPRKKVEGLKGDLDSMYVKPNRKKYDSFFWRFFSPSIYTVTIQITAISGFIRQTFVGNKWCFSKKGEPF